MHQAPSLTKAGAAEMRLDVEEVRKEPEESEAWGVAGMAAVEASGQEVRDQSQQASEGGGRPRDESGGEGVVSTAESQQTIAELQASSEVERLEAELAESVSKLESDSASSKTHIELLEEDVATLLETGQNLARSLAEEQCRGDDLQVALRERVLY